MINIFKKLKRKFDRNLICIVVKHAREKKHNMLKIMYGKNWKDSYISGEYKV